MRWIIKYLVECFKLLNLIYLDFVSAFSDSLCLIAVVFVLHVNVRVFYFMGQLD